MEKQSKPTGKFSLQKELSKSELKQVVGGSSVQTYCSGGPSGPFPVPGSTPIGCNPGYCQPTGHGAFEYCA
jgi:bacteriocin-like protein